MNEKSFDIVDCDLEVSELCLRLYRKYDDEVWLRNANECLERAQRMIAQRQTLTTEQLERATKLLDNKV